MSNRVAHHVYSPFPTLGNGISLNGRRPWDLKIHNYPAMIKGLMRGSLGLGEAYMDGVWDCQEIDTLFSKLATHLPAGLSYATQLRSLLRTGSRKAAYEVGKRHYSLGNDLYEAMLDRRMTYTCAVWNEAASLDQAQENKLALTARKLGMREGMRVLDIGSGWGSMIGYLAETYGVSATGLTVSDEQARYANARYGGDLCRTLTQDYREHKTETPYDRIVSLGMFEHVGHRAYPAFFRCAHSLLAEDGILLLHTITSIDKRTTPDPWVTTYIFPNSEIPTVYSILENAAGLFRLEHAENLGGSNYDKTLMAWWRNFDQAYQSGRLDTAKYDRRFYRMWELYLKGAAGNFRAEKMGIHQFKFRKI